MRFALDFGYIGKTIDTELFNSRSRYTVIMAFSYYYMGMFICVLSML